MRIAFINSVYGIGSTGKIVQSLEKGLTARENECVCFYGRASNGGGQKIASGISVKTHALLSRVFGKHGLFSNHATKKLIKGIKKFNPDVINLHNIHGYYLNYKILFKFLKKYDKPVVWTFHDMWPFTGHCAYFNEDEGCNKSFCVKCKHKREYPKALFDNTKKNYALKKKLFSSLQKLTIVCPSVWLKGVVGQSFLSDKNTVVINNGLSITPSDFPQSDFKEKHGLIGKKVVLGVALQWSERKGLKDFNRLADELGEEYKIVLVGVDKKDEVNPKILSLKKTNGFKELANVYGGSDIFVNPTLNDNFPTVNVEALFFGLPVITYATGGSGEAVDEFCGKVVPKGDYNALKEAIISADYDRQNCIRRANNFTVEHMIDEYEKIFRQVTD